MAFTLALDIDRTITAAPTQLAALAKAVREGGGKVLIVHGTHDKVSTPADYQAAKDKLEACGFAGLYDALYCAPQPIAKNKAIYCKAQRVDLLLDDRKKNCKATVKAGVPAARFIGAS